MASDEEFLTRREAEVILSAGRDASAASKDAHDAQHQAERTALEKADDVEKRERDAHKEAHDREHILHADKHLAEAAAVQTALTAVDELAALHATFHQREHEAHQREHAASQIAIEKAERATDQRFASSNAFREQLNDVIRTLATKDSVEQLQKEADRRFEAMGATLQQQFQAAEKLTQDRYESNRAAIVALEKGDVRGEGKALGQNTTVAVIVGAIGLVGTLLGILVVGLNLATGNAT